MLVHTQSGGSHCAGLGQVGQVGLGQTPLQHKCMNHPLVQARANGVYSKQVPLLTVDIVIIRQSALQAAPAELPRLKVYKWYFPG